jgi:phage baseplate assembly protein W
MAQGLSPSVPLRTDPRDGIKLNKEYIDLVNQNLKMLLLTSPGERIMDPHFGVGMRRFIFEQDHPTIYADISAKIYEQVAKYLPYIELEHLDFQSNGTGNTNIASNLLQLRIIFNIKPLNRTETLDIYYL